MATDPWNAALEGKRQLELGEYPSALLMRAATVLQQEITAVYAREHGLTVPEWRILGRLLESAPMQLSDLCRVSHFDKAYAGRVLRALVARGLASTRPDATHGRRLIIDITAEGRRLAEAIFPVALDAQFRMLEILTPAERRATFSALRKLLALVGETIPKKDQGGPGSPCEMDHESEAI